MHNKFEDVNTSAENEKEYEEQIRIEREEALKAQKEEEKAHLLKNLLGATIGFGIVALSQAGMAPRYFTTDLAENIYRAFLYVSAIVGTVSAKNIISYISYKINEERAYQASFKQKDPTPEFKSETKTVKMDEVDYDELMERMR